MLKEQGRVSEIKDRDQLIRATAEKYLEQSEKPSNDKSRAAAGEKQSVLVVTGYNKDRQDLNNQIRESRIERGQIERGRTFDVQVPANTGPTADSYKPGMQIHFCGERAADGKMHAWGAPLQTVGSVQSVNAEKIRTSDVFVSSKNGEENT